jgi:hypothetical protein
MAVEQERWSRAILDASDHVRAVTLGCLELGFQTACLQPLGNTTLHRTFLAGIAADGNELSGDRGRFLGCEQAIQPRFRHEVILFPGAKLAQLA